MEFNLAQVHEAVAAAIPERVCIVSPRGRTTYAVMTARTRRLADVLRKHGGFDSGRPHDPLAAPESPAGG